MQISRFALWLLVTLAGLGLAGYAYLGNFTRLMADDFCSLYYADQLGLLRSIGYHYHTWSGRYTAFAFDWLILGLGPYKLHYIVPITLILWFLFIVFILYLHFRPPYGASELAVLHSVALAGIFLFLVLVLSPNIPQSLFWWNGMRSYALPLAVLTLYFLMFLIAKQFLRIPAPIAYFLGFTLFFISGGMGETIAIAQAAFILLLIILNLTKLQDSPNSGLFLLFSCLAGAICSLIVIVLAPGNAIRQALLPPAPDFIKLVSVSIQAYLTFLQRLFLAPANFSGLVGAILVALWIGRHYAANFPPVNPRLILAYVLGGMALSFVCFPPGVYGYSAPPPTRTMIIPVFFFVVCILYASFLAGSWLAGSSSPAMVRSELIVLTAALLIGFSAITTASNLFKKRDVYIDFARQWDRVDAEIQQARLNGDESIIIPAMDGWAGLDRPTQNPRFWATKCYSDYYGIQVYGPPY